MVPGATPSVSASATATSGAQGGTAGDSFTGAFNVNKGNGVPPWVLLAAAALAVVFFVWRPQTKR